MYKMGINMSGSLLLLVVVVVIVIVVVVVDVIMYRERAVFL